MKKLLTILSIFITLSVTAQNTHKQSNAYTNEQFQGSVESKVGFINAHFPDTAAANMSWIKDKPFAQITTGQGSFWLRDATATRWIGTDNSTISISSDSSSLIICHDIGSCDTILVATVAPITNFTVISDTSIVVCGVNSCDTIYTLPVNYNQNVVNRVSVVNGVTVDSVFYFINGLKYLAGTIKNAGTQGSILNDSTFLLCNSNSCDTFIVHNITINSFSFTSDSTVSVCNTAGSCDTITFNPIPLGKFFVDSAKIIPGAVDTLFFWINGMKYIGGFVNHLSAVNDGIVSGGIVTYSGSGLTYYVSAATYVIGGSFYSSPDTIITLDPADATNPRIDLFAVDTLNHVIKITGVAASTPLTPQTTPYQLALTTGITLAPNATQPTGTSSTLIYDENTEWTTGGTATVNFNNTANPYHGSKDAYVSSYSKNSTLTFTGITQTVSNQVLRAFIYLPNANYSFQFRFYNGTTAVTNALTLNGFGFNPTLYGSYQNVSIPLSSFTWSGSAFDKLVITMTGKGATGTFYIDYISLESGTPVIIPPMDYSNKVDSTTTKKINDSTYVGLYWAKGISYQKGDTIKIHSSATDSINVSRLSGGKIDTSHLPVANIYIQQAGAGETHIVRAGNDTTLLVAALKNSDDISFSKNTDSSVSAHLKATGITAGSYTNINATVDTSGRITTISNGSSGTGSVVSVTGNPSGLVDNTDPANPVIQQDVLKLDKSDSTIANRITANTTNIATNATNIASNTTAIGNKADKSTTITINGNTQDLSTNRSWTISSGGTSTVDQTITATAGQTNFVFTTVPIRFLITINGIVYDNYTVSGSTITVGMTDILAGDKIRLYQTQ